VRSQIPFAPCKCSCVVVFIVVVFAMVLAVVLAMTLAMALAMAATMCQTPIPRWPSFSIFSFTCTPLTCLNAIISPGKTSKCLWLSLTETPLGTLCLPKANRGRPDQLNDLLGFRKCPRCWVGCYKQSLGRRCYLGEPFLRRDDFLPVRLALSLLEIGCSIIRLKD
jgi:hypothetical protein